MGGFFGSATALTPAAPEVLYFAGDIQLIIVWSLLIAIVCTAIHFVLAFLLPVVFPSLQSLHNTAQSDLLMQAMWLVTCIPLPVMYALAMPELVATPETRWHGHSWLVEWALMLHVGTSIYEAAMYVVYGKSWVYSVHHVIVVYAYGLGLYVGRMHVWGAWDGLVEFTNINVCILKIMLILNVGRGTPAEAINGGMLYLVYLFTRVISLPLMLSTFAYDVLYHNEETWQWAIRGGGFEGTRATACTLLTYSTPPCTLVIWILSCLWFLPIHRGMVKVLKGVDPLKGEKAADDLVLGNDASKVVAKQD